jgi:hypothetical protein
MATNGATGHNPTSSGTGFLSFNSLPPRLIVTSEDKEFDETTLQHWRDEGFDVTYLPMDEGGKPYVQALKSVPDELGKWADEERASSDPDRRSLSQN